MTKFISLLFLFISVPAFAAKKVLPSTAESKAYEICRQLMEVRVPMSEYRHWMPLVTVPEAAKPLVQISTLNELTILNTLMLNDLSEVLNDLLKKQPQVVPFFNKPITRRLFIRQAYDDLSKLQSRKTWLALEYQGLVGDKLTVKSVEFKLPSPIAVSRFTDRILSALMGYAMLNLDKTEATSESWPTGSPTHRQLRMVLEQRGDNPWQVVEYSEGLSENTDFENTIGIHAFNKLLSAADFIAMDDESLGRSIYLTGVIATTEEELSDLNKRIGQGQMVNGAHIKMLERELRQLKKLL